MGDERNQRLTTKALERQLPVLKAIIFDFDGTLTDFLSADLAALTMLHQRAVLAVPLNDFVSASVEAIMAFHRRVERAETNPLEMHRERLQATFEQCMASWQDEYLTLYREQLIQTCTPLAGAHDLLRALRPRFKLALLTNAYDGEEQRLRLRRSGLEAYFEAVVVSDEVGWFKPQPEVFLHTLGLLGVRPGEALYIGDSPRHDVAGAKAAGMRAVLIRPGSAHPDAWLTVATLEALARLWTATAL